MKWRWFMSKAILFSSVSSPHCFKVSMILEEKGVDFERVEINLREKEQKSDDYLALNPKGQVPAYKDEQGMVLDSLDIMQYLDKRYPSYKLFPSEAEKLKNVLGWIESSSTTIRDVSHHLYWQLLQPPKGGTDWEEVKHLKTLGYEQLTLMEQALETNSEWLCGDLSAADFSVFAWVYGYKRFELPSDWADYPKVQGWLERINNRPSVAVSYQQTGIPFSDYLKQS